MGKQKMANFLSKPLHGPSTEMWEYGVGQMPSHFKVAFWNVNGIRSIIKKGNIY